MSLPFLHALLWSQYLALKMHVIVFISSCQIFTKDLNRSPYSLVYNQTCSHCLYQSLRKFVWAVSTFQQTRRGLYKVIHKSCFTAIAADQFSVEYRAWRPCYYELARYIIIISPSRRQLCPPIPSGVRNIKEDRGDVYLMILQDKFDVFVRYHWDSIFNHEHDWISHSLQM